ncbi:putative p-aminobenzoyl-glutamate transporter [Vibrio cholerae]|uniref:AbgT family transporter n=1 Tax=Vibrio cholerae TaxID=666 RepID=UPI0011DA1AC6|nr:AbgT family transporter [Vibrio cholerae]TXX90532.1 AbgT family transporter [Vibrio cholerae]GHW45603.1 putative p-aminobenzoyl-glutamate transporter [Vibrio cholerae]
MNNEYTSEKALVKKGKLDHFLNCVELAGNKMPDPAILFFWALIITWCCSWLLSDISFELINPKTEQPVVVYNLLTGQALVDSLANMVTTFTSFAPLGLVLVSMLGVGVAEASGFIGTSFKKMLSVIPSKLLTPTLLLISILSSIAGDAGYILIIPLGGVLFHAAGRHPLAGIAVAFAGVSGGFSANFFPTSVDPLLASFTQTSARLLDAEYVVNPLANIFFTGLSPIVLVVIGWYVTEKIVEPRLSKMPFYSDEKKPEFGQISEVESRAFKHASRALILGIILLAIALIPDSSPFRSANGEITGSSAPIMRSIVPITFLLFVIPGYIYGKVAGTFKNSGDMVTAMSDTMASMGLYIVMSFFCAQFLAAFVQSNIGTMLALYGAEFLKALNLPTQFSIIWVILLTSGVNLIIGTSSAKWAFLAPVLVPMLMAVGISPEFTQAAYRVGDSVSNIISPLLVFYPLVVRYCQRYVKTAGIGTLASLMMPFSIAMLLGWSVFLLLFWTLGIPLGIEASYTYMM